MNEQELWKMIESLAKLQMETARQMQETDRRMQETDRRMQETDRLVRQVSKQLGEWGNRWGSFAEGMAKPSLDRMLKEDFGMDVVGPDKSHINGRSLEIDVLAYDNGSRNEAYVVEIKSRLTENAIKQILNTLSDAPTFFPHLQGRKLFGILAAVDIPDNARNQAIKAGLYVARMSDDIFSLSVPKGFKPKDFGQTAHRNGKPHGRKKKSPSN